MWGLETKEQRTVTIEQSTSVLGVNNDVKVEVKIDDDIELNYSYKHENPLFQIDLDVSINIPNPFAGNDDSKRHTPDQEALTGLAKEAERKGGVTQNDAETLVEWGEETGLPSRGPENHGGASGDHIHIGPVNHLPVK
jgi:hypothetical protein